MREAPDPLCKARCTFYSTTMQKQDKHLWRDMGTIDVFVTQTRRQHGDQAKLLVLQWNETAC